MIFIYYYSNTQRSDTLKDNFDKIDDLIADMCQKRPQRRPTCQHLVNVIRSCSIHILSSQLSPDLLTNVNNEEVSKYSLVKYIKSILNL